MLRLRASVAAVVLGIALAACAPGAAPKPTQTLQPPPDATSNPAAPATPMPSTATEIGCDLGGHDGAYHIHSGVGIRVDGQLYAPPANIGITTCMYWVHTHDANGVVHIEAPETVHPTLGDFLDIWGKTYPDDELLAKAREAIAAGEVTVDDKPFTGDATALVLADKMRIVLGG
ncbi:MAG TPA: hypothetical protein VFV72_07335 [Candidatus Limnocylindrales bacterium]|nr:hypothetical protein [Candidatus Limnocylindrales bacterium]